MYDEADIKKILGRAFELHNRREGSHPFAGSREKLSLEEVEEIAAELGLSPEYVRQAAKEYEGIPNEEPLFLDTGNTHEVELIGHAKGTLDQKTWAELRSMIEYHFDSPGKVKRRPLGIIWKAEPQGILSFLQTRKSPSVEVKNSDTKTTIRIKQNLKTYNKLFWPGYAAIGGAAMLFAVALVEEAPEALFFTAGLLLLAKLFHRWKRKRVRKVRGQLKDLMDQLQTIVTRRFSAEEKKKEENASESRPLIELEDGEEVSEENMNSSKGKVHSSQ